MKKRPRHKRKPKMRIIRLWNYPQALKALPYVESVTHSLREHWLEMQRNRIHANRLSGAPGKANRDAIIAQEHAVQYRTDSEDRFAEALNELMGIDVYLYDPLRGIAFIPFRKNETLAWFVFDLFDSKQIKEWRFHEDPLEQRRPIDEVLNDESVNPVVV